MSFQRPVTVHLKDGLEFTANEFQDVFTIKNEHGDSVMLTEAQFRECCAVYAELKRAD